MHLFVLFYVASTFAVKKFLLPCLHIMVSLPAEVTYRSLQDRQD